MTIFDDEKEFNEQTFEGIDLRETVIRGKEFYECTFIQCRFIEATFSSCKFIDCTFKNCDLSNMKINMTRFRDLKSEDSKWVGVNFTNAESVSHLNFIRCVLNYSNFLGLDLRRSKFEHCVAREVDFRQANLTEAVCTGTDFSGTQFASTNLTKADFRKAIQYSIRPNDNTLKSAKFSFPEAAALLHGLDIIIAD